MRRTILQNSVNLLTESVVKEKRRNNLPMSSGNFTGSVCELTFVTVYELSGQMQ